MEVDLIDNGSFSLDNSYWVCCLLVIWKNLFVVHRDSDSRFDIQGSASGV